MNIENPVVIQNRNLDIWISYFSNEKLIQENIHSINKQNYWELYNNSYIIHSHLGISYNLKHL